MCVRVRVRICVCVCVCACECDSHKKYMQKKAYVTMKRIPAQALEGDHPKHTHKSISVEFSLVLTSVPHTQGWVPAGAQAPEGAIPNIHTKALVHSIDTEQNYHLRESDRLQYHLTEGALKDISSKTFERCTQHHKQILEDKYFLINKVFNSAKNTYWIQSGFDARSTHTGVSPRWCTSTWRRLCQQYTHKH